MVVKSPVNKVTPVWCCCHLWSVLSKAANQKHMTININYTLTERTELDSDYRHLDANKNSVIQNINMYWFSYIVYIMNVTILTPHHKTIEDNTMTINLMKMLIHNIITFTCRCWVWCSIMNIENTRSLSLYSWVYYERLRGRDSTRLIHSSLQKQGPNILFILSSLSTNSKQVI